MIQPHQQIGGEPEKVQLSRFRWQICAFSALFPRCSSLSIIYLDYVFLVLLNILLDIWLLAFSGIFFGWSPHRIADECDRRAPSVLTPTSCYAKGKAK